MKCGESLVPTPSQHCNQRCRLERVKGSGGGQRGLDKGDEVEDKTDKQSRHLRANSEGRPGVYHSK